MTSSYDDAYASVFEALNDPDIYSEAQLVISNSEPSDDKPWELPSDASPTTIDVKCFYYKPKNNMVNGTVIQTGQKALLVQLDVPEASLLLAKWIDKAGKQWQIKTLEPVELNDKVIYYKLLIGV